MKKQNASHIPQKSGSSSSILSLLGNTIAKGLTYNINYN